MMQETTKTCATTHNYPQTLAQVNQTYLSESKKSLISFSAGSNNHTTPKIDAATSKIISHIGYFPSKTVIDLAMHGLIEISSLFTRRDTRECTLDFDFKPM